MDIKEQFNLIAQEYDQKRRLFIPCFDEYYDKTTSFISANLPTVRRVVDLGAGTGLLTSFWYKHYPQAEYILTDIAGEMMQVAQKRFAGLENFSYLEMDYTKSLPDGECDAVISGLSIHHLEDAAKQKLFDEIYAKLDPKGVCVNYDQFRAGSDQLDKWYDEYWVKQLESSGLTPHDIELWKERRKLDKECTVEAEVDMLRKSGFSEVQCVYCCRKFAVILAVK